MGQHIIPGPTVGLVMREACVRAMTHAIDRCFEVEASAKGIKHDGRTDWVTPADPECEKIVIDILRENFPTYGIVSEETDLVIPCTVPDEQIYFTVDPIDGTSAYKRHQSTGWGSMLSLVHGGEVVAVCVGDANSGEMYYYRPGSFKTHRLLRRGHNTKDVPMSPHDFEGRPLNTQFVQLRSMPFRHSQLVQEMVDSGLFQDAETTNGSIGLSEARRWKGEIGASILRQRVITPWDETPVIGMDARLGFIALEISSGTREIQRVELRVPVTKRVLPDYRELLIIHRSRIDDLGLWADHNKVRLTR